MRRDTQTRRAGRQKAGECVPLCDRAKSVPCGNRKGILQIRQNAAEGTPGKTKRRKKLSVRCGKPQQRTKIPMMNRPGLCGSRIPIVQALSASLVPAFLACLSGIPCFRADNHARIRIIPANTNPLHVPLGWFTNLHITSFHRIGRLEEYVGCFDRTDMCSLNPQGSFCVPCGGGNIHWQEFGAVLKAIDYNGAIVMKPFVLKNADNAHRTCTWRNLMEEPIRCERMVEMARNGATFLRGLKQ